MDYPCPFLTFTYVNSYSRSIFLVCILKMHSYWDFPGGPVFKTPCSQCRVHGINPWSGNSEPTCCIATPKKKSPYYRGCRCIHKNVYDSTVHHGLKLKATQGCTSIKQIITVGHSYVQSYSAMTMNRPQPQQ